jgi:hypothetical protein
LVCSCLFAEKKSVSALSSISQMSHVTFLTTPPHREKSPQFGV